MLVRWARGDVDARRVVSQSGDDSAGHGQRTVDRVAGRRFLRQVVASVVGSAVGDVALSQVCADCGGDHGRPVVTIAGRPGPHVSLARADGLVVVAVADRPVGVDVEFGRAGVAPTLAPVVLSAVERWALVDVEADEVDRLVLQAWVRKEAILKATGHGLRIEPATVVVDGEPPRLVAWDGPGRRPAIRLADVTSASGYVAALAITGRGRGRVAVDVSEGTLA